MASERQSHFKSSMHTNLEIWKLRKERKADVKDTNKLWVTDWLIIGVENSSVLPYLKSFLKNVDTF